MGLKFIENAGGNKMYFCASCYIYLADKAACVSTSFTGMTGQAYLFKRAINIALGPMVLRGMLTGDHYVRDAFCVSCDEKIGWMYEMAPTKEECYKKGSVILERLHILEVDGITKPHQLDGPRRQPPLTLDADMLNRVREQQRRRVQARQDADRRQNMHNVFRFNADGDVPVVEIFDGENLAETFGFNEDEMTRTRQDVQELNDAILAYSRGNHNDLWNLGFRADVARTYREFNDILDGEPYRGSVHADRNLMHLFTRMHRERERMRFHDQHDADRLEFENWAAQNEQFFRGDALVRRHSNRHRRRTPQEYNHPEVRAFREEIETRIGAQLANRRAVEDPAAPRAELANDVQMMLHMEGLLVVNATLAEQAERQRGL